ncbi:helix-turn-helix domain-containing protein [Kitasatospora sp. CB02891]|uniref:helix-turn-helix domain-containing protein n=1 Tax=Kitasatospora sp. CB02891 TaxID=2020329 RepID=UPI000C26EED8|nr:transcriptional regulator [Kitasatospora sp. CB02891]
MTPNGTAIRAIRTASGIGLRVLALRAGRHRSFLSRVERGLAGASDDTLRAVADALGVEVGAITREDSP